MDAGELVQILKSPDLYTFVNMDYARAYGRQAVQQVQSHRQIMEVFGICHTEDCVIAGILAGLLDGTVIDPGARLQLTHDATFSTLRAVVEAGRDRIPSCRTYRLA